MIHGVVDFINLPQPSVSSHLSTHAPTCIRTNICMYQHIPTYACTNVYQHIDVPTYTCTCTSTYTCTRTNICCIDIYQQSYASSYTYAHINITHINPAIHAPSSFVHIWYLNTVTTLILKCCHKIRN